MSANLQPAPLPAPQSSRQERVASFSEALAGDERPSAIPAACWQVLDQALSTPDLQPLAGSLSIGVDAALGLPFRVGPAGQVVLSTAALGHPAAARVLLRHAAEIAMLAGRSGEPTSAMAAALVAARVAGLHLAARPRAGREMAERTLHPPLLSAYRQLTRDEPLAHVTALLGRTAVDLALLLQLGGLDEAAAHAAAADLAARTEAANLFARAAAVAIPAEVLLASGGDTRIAILPETGRNSYGSSPLPVEDELAFSSSTASSVSRRQLEAVEALRGRLIAAALDGTAEAAATHEIEDVRARVLSLAGAGDLTGCEAVLAASGTDAELIALSVALSIGGRPVTSILIDPNETGSGIPQAALGQHYSERTAHGAKVAAGTAIAGFAEGLATAICVALRDAEGRVRPADEVDIEVARHVVAAVSAGRHVLLHVLDAAKTGVGAPSLAAVDSIAGAAEDSVTVVVDACQMRLGAAAMRACLQRGWLLQVTGSKFYSGPPFCGALILPGSTVRKLAECDPAPGALAAYSGWREWPQRLAGHALGLSSTTNHGLIARWQAALAEADDFARVPAAEARAFLEHFASEAETEIASHAELAAVAAEPFERSLLGTDNAFAGLKTILPFLLLGLSGQPLSLDEAKRAHKLMMQDLSGALPEEGAASARVHLGQPVKMGHPSGITTGALRLCASARTVTDALLERSPEAVLGEMRLAVAKAALAARELTRL